MDDQVPVEQISKSTPEPREPLSSRLYVRLLHYKEQWAAPFFALFVLYLFIQCVRFLTGRAVVDDPGILVSMGYNAMGIVLAVMVVGFLSDFIIPEVDEKDMAVPWQKVAVEAFTKICLLAWFSYLIVQPH